MNKLLFVLVMGVLLFAFVGCKGKSTPPPNNISTPEVMPLIVPVKKIVVYDFWAPWCPPCRAFSPIFESWKQKYGKNNIEFKKVNTDEDKELTEKFRIGSIPCVIITVDGTEVKRWTGAPRESEITPFLQ